MKEAYYFSHDYNARNDIKIKKLLAKHGYYGYGLFWAIIEELYNNENQLPLDCDFLAYDLRAESEIIESIINDFDLFILSKNTFGSRSVQQRLDKRNKVSEKAKEAINKRWNKGKGEGKKEGKTNGSNTNVLPENNEPNTIKERKGKEIKEKKGNKGKEIKEIKETTNTEKKLIEIFDIFRKNYPGTKVGLTTEYTNLKKKHKDYKEVIPKLPEILKTQIRVKAKREQAGEFVPVWKHLSTWLNQRCWEEEYAEIKTNRPPELAVYSNKDVPENMQALYQD